MKKTVNAFSRIKELGIITEDEKQDLITKTKASYKSPKGRVKLGGKFIRDTEKAILMTINRNKRKPNRPNSLWIPKKLIKHSDCTVTVPAWYIERLKKENKL